MSNINQLATSNTFSQWLTGTQELISKMNSLTDGGNASTFYANTNLALGNNVTIGGDLTVTGNIVLDSIGYDDLTVAGNTDITGYLSVTGNTTIVNTYVTYANIETANITLLTGDANTAIYANISAVSADVTATGSYANSAFLHANSSYESQNTTGVYANSGFSVANSAAIYANGAFTAANTAASDGLAFAIALG